MGALVGFDQRLTVGDRDLIVVRMDFAECQEAMAVAAIFDERRLQRRLYARDLGEIDIAAELLALGGLEIKLFDAVAADTTTTRVSSGWVAAQDRTVVEAGDKTYCSDLDSATFDHLRAVAERDGFPVRQLRLTPQSESL